MNQTDRAHINICIETLQAQINDCLRLSYSIRSSINKYTSKYKEDQLSKLEGRMRALEAGIIALQGVSKPKTVPPMPKGATHYSSSTSKYYKTFSNQLFQYCEDRERWLYVISSITESALDNSPRFEKVYF